MAGMLTIMLQNGAAGQPPKHPRQAVLRQSRRTGRWLWRCAGGGPCTGRNGIGHTWAQACREMSNHFKTTNHEEK